MFLLEIFKKKWQFNCKWLLSIECHRFKYYYIFFYQNLLGAICSRTCSLQATADAFLQHSTSTDWVTPFIVKDPSGLIGPFSSSSHRDPFSSPYATNFRKFGKIFFKAGGDLNIFTKIFSRTDETKSCFIVCVSHWSPTLPSQFWLN